MFCSCATISFLALFSYYNIVIVQNASLRMTDRLLEVTEGHVTPKGVVPLEGCAMIHFVLLLL